MRELDASLGELERDFRQAQSTLSHNAHTIDTLQEQKVRLGEAEVGSCGVKLSALFKE